MKKLVLLLTLALSAAPPPARAQTTQPPTAAAPPAGAAVRVEAPKFVPEAIAALSLRDLEGRDFRLADLRGRVYVLNLWATWCGPCRAEIPGFNKVFEDYAARGVEFVGLTVEDPEQDAERVRDFAREVGVKYRLGWLGKETAREMTSWGSTRTGRFVIPQTFVVAADGRIVLHVRGYNPRVPEMIREGVERALKAAPAAGAAPARP
ncbi:MAG TPA: TlpA disulfide reductase family protein [Pyrinomonadaceae bacterium]|jgi:thiol-disulfide isomerase/thioredoxin